MEDLFYFNYDYCLCTFHIALCYHYRFLVITGPHPGQPGHRGVTLIKLSINRVNISNSLSLEVSEFTKW